MGILANLVGRSDIAGSKGQRTIHRLLRALGHRGHYGHLAAVQTLGTLDVLPAVEPLVAALKDPTASTRLAAVHALGALGDPRAAQPLAAALNDRDPKIREAIVRALRALDDRRAVVPLCTALKDETRSVREAAICALRELKDLRATEPLCAALDDVDPELRRAAAAALGELNDLRATEPLCAALDDTSINVRSAAAAALGQLKDPRAVEPLIAAISQHRFHTHILVWALRRRYRRLRMVAAEALGKEQTATEIAALIEAQNDSDPDVRRTATTALNKIATQIGRLRTDRTEQQRFKDCLVQLPVVDIARWALLNGARFGPMTPGDDTILEQTFKNPEQLIQFLIGEKPSLRISWFATGEAVIVEYFYRSTGRLNGRFVILRRDKPAEYHCYLAWLVVHHGSYETVHLEALA